MASISCLIENHDLDGDDVRQAELELKEFILQDLNPPRTETGYKMEFCDDTDSIRFSDSGYRKTVIFFKKNTPYEKIEQLSRIYKDRLEMIAFNEQLNSKQTELVTNIEIVAI